MGVILQDTTPMKVWSGRTYGCDSKAYTFDQSGCVDVSEAEHIRHFVQEHGLRPISATDDGRFVVLDFRRQSSDHHIEQVFDKIDQYGFLLVKDGAAVLHRKSLKETTKR